MAPSKSRNHPIAPTNPTTGLPLHDGNRTGTRNVMTESRRRSVYGPVCPRDGGPLYLPCKRFHAIAAWLVIVVDMLLILLLGGWLTLHHDTFDLGIFLPLAFATAVFIADFLSGLVHWATDTWFDETVFERMILIAREHHLFPRHILAYRFRDYVSFMWPATLLLAPVTLYLALLAIPSTVVFFSVVVCFVTSWIVFFGMYFHRLGHDQSTSRIIRALQDCGLLITTRHHGVHHRGNHDVRYCLINGWADHVCDAIGFWRAMEWLVQQGTGAIPRCSDREWRARGESR